MYPIDLSTQVVLLPCLGASSRLFGRQKRVFGDPLITPEWIEAQPNESVGDYARRWAKSIEPMVDPDRPLLVGGVSLGGIMALEMAQRLGAEAVILISAPRRSAEIASRTRVMELTLRRLSPRLLGKLLPTLAVPFSLIDQLDDDDLKLVRQLARAADPAFIQWGAGAMMDFESEGESALPIHRIHGAKDWLTPPPADADRVIPDGGHLINLSHPDTVNRFIANAAENPKSKFQSPELKKS